MADSIDGHRWTVVFDAGRFGHFFDGIETGESEAIASALRQARLARDAREADFFAPYLSIRIGTGPGDMHGVTMPMTDLDLDDRTLADKVRAGMLEGLARADALHDAMTAAEQRGPTGSPTAATSVEEQIRRIRKALGTIAPAGASERFDTIMVDSARLSDIHAWPHELVDFLTIDKPVVRLTPYGALYEVAEMIAARTHLIKMRDQTQKHLNYPDLSDLADWSAEPAGSAAYAFLDAFVPIAGDDRDYLVVDLRDGELNGSVSVYQREGDISGPTWVSISAMLSDLADSLESGTEFDRVWIPTFSNSSLSWDAP